MTKIALAMICKADDNEAAYLEQCLKNVSPYVDGIFITITGENEKCEKVCKKYKANVSHIQWENDFAKARNYNFSQVPKEYDYIFWLDCDDVVRGLDCLSLIEEHPECDGFTMYYLYAFDKFKNPTVTHLKTRIIKNDGSIKWVGALHEDFQSNRDLNLYLLKEVEVIHTATDTKFEKAKARNLEVAKEDFKKHPNDPRSYWNLGNSQKAIGMTDKAIETFTAFLEKSQSDEEKYIACLRLSECYIEIKDHNKAIDAARRAIGLKPEYPDAYHLLGNILFSMGNYHKASEMFISGLTKKPPYTNIIVFNPRDYDSTPLLNLAKCYFNMSRPDLAVICLENYLKIVPRDKETADLLEKIKVERDKFNAVLPHIQKLESIEDDEELRKEINNLPDEIRSHPSVCYIRNTRLIKKESSGKDLVFYCGFTEEEWSPDSMKTGIGGSEEAIIHLAKLLSDKGWNVSVYNNCGYKEKNYDGVIYKPFWSWNYRDKQDVVILWRSPKACDYEINADTIIVDLHDMVNPGEFTEKRLAKIDKIFVKSNFHRSVYPDIPDNKFVVIPNGIDTDTFKEETEKDPYLIINTSSPDRSLSTAIKVFKEVKKQIPEAKMKWAYGWKVFDVVHSEDNEEMKWKAEIIKEMKEAGIENLGRVSHEEVAELYKKASIFLYPSEFAEIDCISLSKAMAGGAIPITTDFAAMGEKQGHGGYFIKSKKNKDNWCKPYQYDFAAPFKREYVDRCVKLLQNPPQDRSIMREHAFKNYSWDLISNRWNNEIQSIRR